MSTRDDDILDFEFFDDEADAATGEAAVSRPPARDPEIDAPDPEGSPPRSSRPSGPSFPGRHGGLVPLLRLVGLVALGILVAVLLVVWAQGCSSTAKRDSYSDYNDDIGDVGSASALVGKDLATVLTKPGLKQAELETRLKGLIQREQSNLAKGESLDPPGPVLAAHENALRALELRLVGLRGLLEQFVATKTSQDSEEAGQRLAAQATRFPASDTVWADLFQSLAASTYASEGVTGITPPASVFVTNETLYTPTSMTSVWLRVHGASTGGTPTGAHGSGVESVTVSPASAAKPSATLSTDTDTTINVTTDLAFDVSVLNSGDFQEVGLKVTLTIPKSPQPIVRTATIDVLDAGDSATVTFKNFPNVPFSESVLLKVDVEPVPGETNRTNNSYEYPVVFSLTP